MEQRELDTNKKDKGFTLIELLIVIVILGILATVTVIAVNGITSRAEGNACATEMAVVETAVEAYIADAGVPAVNVDVADTTVAGAPAALGNYLKKPTDYVFAVADGVVSTAEANCTPT